MSFDATINRAVQEMRRGASHDEYYDQITVKESGSHPNLGRVDELHLANHIVEQAISFQLELMTGRVDFNRRFPTRTTPFDLKETTEGLLGQQVTVENAIQIFKSIHFNKPQ